MAGEQDIQISEFLHTALELYPQMDVSRIVHSLIYSSLPWMFPEEFPSCSESLRDLTWLSLAGEPSMLEEFPFLPKSPPSVQTSSLGTALCQKFPFPGCSIVPCHQKLPGILLGSTTSTGTQQKQSKEIFFFFFRQQPQLLALLQAPEPFPDRKVHPGIKKKNKIRGSVLLSSVSWMSSS